MVQKTAVEWLIEQYENDFPLTFDAMEQALEMEKEQIENAFNQGFSTPQWDKSKENKAEQYYNENFKSE